MECRFVISSPDLARCPENPDRLEFAMVGRSNVGKSSLINMMTGRKQLAKTSKTPGKTRLINFFEVGDAWMLVDLPGYGYAKVSKTEQAKWGESLGQFLVQRESLKMVLMLVDGKIGPQPNDYQMADWLVHHGIPFAVVLTKADQSKLQLLSKHQSSAMALGGMAVFVTSAEKRQGADPIWNWLGEVLKPQEKPTDPAII